MKKTDKKKAQTLPAKPKRGNQVKGGGSDAQDPKEERMDFGGLPDRDLKKNLGGCG